MTIVNSWNEWDQLKHVIVGKVDYANVDDSLHALKSGLAAKESLLNNKQIMV